MTQTGCARVAANARTGFSATSPASSPETRSYTLLQKGSRAKPNGVAALVIRDRRSPGGHVQPRHAIETLPHRWTRGISRQVTGRAISPTYRRLCPGTSVRTG
jgi:hypothetical protein